MTHEAGIEAASDAYMDGEPDFYLADRVSEIIQAYISASGMVLVPREPTEAMVYAFDVSLPQYVVNYIQSEDEINGFKAMLDAAPNPFKSNP